ncbi:MAG TPA: helical backbone metal receptor, partial [Desulfurivibrionaceae bacterium]|nr:helical backbone metal receptor [Desulfurivibrionaceae bacterium]
MLIKAFALAGCLALAMMLLPMLCGARAVVDQAGRRVVVPERPQRVVSLAPSITEVVYALGRQDLLKGTTQYSDDPPEAKSLPRVGSYVRLDVEKIVALKPDLCLAIKDGNPLHTVTRLEELGIPVYVVDPRNLAGIIKMIIGLGEVMGATESANLIITEMRARAERIAARLGPAPSRPRVFFQIDASPIVSAGRGTFIDELITLAGGRNLAGGSEGYPRFGWEELLRLDPEVAIVASMAGGFSPAELKAGWQKWPQLAAVKNRRLYVIDARLVDRPT